MVEIATSLLSAKEENIIQKIYDLEVAKTDYFHIDVMDGKFVENDTTERMRKYTEYIKNVSTLPIDVHLMVEDIQSYIDSYLAMGVHSITFQLEACKNETEVIKLIKYIKENGCKVGIAVNANTPIEKVYEYVPHVHKILVMTVEAGKGGQKLIPKTLDKIRELNKFIYENNYETDIQADGGINNETAQKVIAVGANILVSGNYIINSDNYKQAIESLKE